MAAQLVCLFVVGGSFNCIRRRSNFDELKTIQAKVEMRFLREIKRESTEHALADSCLELYHRAWLKDGPQVA